MCTYFVNEVEVYNGNIFTCQRFFNSDDDFSYNSLVFVARDRSDEECEADTQASRELMELDIEAQFSNL